MTFYVGFFIDPEDGFMYPGKDVPNWWNLNW